MLLYKFLERVQSIDFSAYFICDPIASLQPCLDQGQGFNGPVDKGNAAVGHALQKLVDQFLCQYV